MTTEHRARAGQSTEQRAERLCVRFIPRRALSVTLTALLRVCVCAGRGRQEGRADSQAEPPGRGAATAHYHGEGREPGGEALV